MSASYALDKRCPCGTGLQYGQCCYRYHQGLEAPTAETLMRSRYSAFVVQDESYLLRTWDPFTRPTGPLALDKSPISFYRLDILGVQGGGPLDTAGQVEFEAFYRIEIPKTSPDMTANGSANITRGSQREISTFRREDGRWFYSDGLVN